MLMGKQTIILIDGDRVVFFYEDFPITKVYKYYLRDKDDSQNIICYTKKGNKKILKVREMYDDRVAWLFRLRRAQSHKALKNIHKNFSEAIVLLKKLNPKPQGEENNRPLREAAKILSPDDYLIVVPRDQLKTLLNPSVLKKIPG
jgi:hypothetical protein